MKTTGTFPGFLAMVFALAACDSGTGDDASADAYSEAPAEETMPAGEVVDETDGAGASLQVGPDGATLEVDEGNVDLNVRTDDPALQVETD